MTQEVVAEVIQKYLKQGITDFTQLLAEIGEEPPLSPFRDEIEVYLYITHKKSYEIYRLISTTSPKLVLSNEEFTDIVQWGSENKRARNKVRAVIRSNINTQLSIWKPEYFLITTSVRKKFKGMLLKHGTTAEVHNQLVRLGETAPTIIDQALAYNGMSDAI